MTKQQIIEQSEETTPCWLTSYSVIQNIRHASSESKSPEINKIGIDSHQI